MKALAVAALGAIGVLLWVVRERRWTVDSLVAPGICKDPPQPTHYWTISPEWRGHDGSNMTDDSAETTLWV